MSFSPKRLFKIAFAIGSIIAVEAVLLNHMDRKDVVNIIPKISLEERKKEKLNIFRLQSSLIYYSYRKKSSCSGITKLIAKRTSVTIL